MAQSPAHIVAEDDVPGRCAHMQCEIHESIGWCVGVMLATTRRIASDLANRRG